MSASKLSSIKSRLSERRRGIMGQEEMKAAALLIPLIEKEGAVHVLFEVRAFHLKAQPGDICFPGGRAEDEDRSMEETAIRETCEELGIRPEQIEIIAPLDVLVSRHAAIIYPYVGTVAQDVSLRPDPAEVAEVFTVPLDYFLSVEPERHDVPLKVEPPEDFPYHLIVGGKNYNWRTGAIPEFFYVYEDYAIWGMTAKILYHFVQLIRS